MTEAVGSRVERVQWLGTTEPPRDITMHLRMRGLELCTNAHQSKPAARLTLLDPSALRTVRTPKLEGCRVAVMDPDPGSADALSQALREKGAEVVALSVNPESLERAAALDPDVVVMEPRDFLGSCWEIVRAIWQHPRLRFATILLASPEPIGPGGSSVLDVQSVSEAIRLVSADYERVRDQARASNELELSLDVLGPARTLRALLEGGRSLRAHFSCPDLTVEVDVTDNIIVGAQGGPGAQLSDTYLGAHALSVLLWQNEGHVRVRRVDRPAVTNIMAPLTAALHQAFGSAQPRSSGVHWAPVLPPGVDRAGVSMRAAARVDSVVTKSRGPSVAPPQASEPPPPNVLTQDAARVVAVASPVHSKRPRAEVAVAPVQETSPRPLRTLVGIAPPALPGAAAKLAAATSARRAPPSEARATPQVSVLESAPVAPPVMEYAPVAPPAAPMQVAHTTPYAGQPAVAAQVMQHAARAHVPAAVAQVGQHALTAPGVQPPTAALAPAALAHVPPPAVVIHVAPPAESAPQVPSFEDAQLAPDTASHLEPPRPLHQRRGPLVAAAAGLVMVLLWVFFSPGQGAMPPAVQAVPKVSAKALPPAPAPEKPREAVAAPAPEPAEEDDAALDDSSRRARAKRASRLVSQGHSFRRRGLLDTAETRYSEALEEYPGYPRAFAGLSHLAMRRGDGDKAVSYAQKLVNARPSEPDHLVLLGDAYKSAGKPNDAREAWKKAVRLGSSQARRRLAD